MNIYKNLKKALVIANHPLLDKDFSFIDSLLKSEDINNLILKVPQKIKLLNGAVATGDSDIFSAIYNLKITEEITKDDKVKFLEWAILAKEPSIVSDICKLKSTGEITKEQQKKLISLATKSNDVNIINYINNYNFLNPKSKEEEAPKGIIPKPLIFSDKKPQSYDKKSREKSVSDFTNDNFLNPKSKEEEAPYATIPKELNFSDINRDTEPLMVDNKKQKSWIQKLKNLVNSNGVKSNGVKSNGVKYQQKRRDSDSQGGHNGIS